MIKDQSIVTDDLKKEVRDKLPIIASTHEKKQKEKKERIAEKSVNAKVRVKKKSAIKRALSSFIGEDVVDVRGYLIHEVLIPAGKDLIFDIVESLTGHRGSRRRNILNRGQDRRGNSRVSYDRSYTGSGSPKRDRRGSREIDDIYLDDRGAGEEVIDYMTDLIVDYKCASVADLYGFLGISSTHADEKYGWYDFRDAKVRRTRDDEYLLLLPRAEVLD